MIEFILGDLREEYLLLRGRRGRLRARLWYLRQLLLSLPMIAGPASILRPVSIAFTMLLLDRLWCLIYSWIPLKDGLERAPGFLMANIVCACVCALQARPAPWAAFIAAGFALAFSVSAEPSLYVAAALIAVPFSARIGRKYEVA